MGKTDTLPPEAEYKFINPSRYEHTLKNNPLWYKNAEISELLNKFIFSEPEQPNADWQQTMEEVVRMFATGWENGSLALEDREEGWNDDDRWSEMYLGKNPKVEKDHPDTVVVHHTHTRSDISIPELEALALLRLYVPEAINGFPIYETGTFHPISSGHYRDGKQTFFGYHYLVRPDGSTIQSLRNDAIGFHAGDYKTNCRSYGIVMTGSFMTEEPSDAAIDAVNGIISSLSPEVVLGHREVAMSAGARKGQLVNTECPGATYPNWKHKLFTPQPFSQAVTAQNT